MFTGLRRGVPHLVSFALLTATCAARSGPHESLRATVSGQVPGPGPAAAVSARRPPLVTVDASTTHQTMQGFGATHVSLVYDGGAGDVLGPRVRERAIEAVYAGVRITTGNLEGALLESPGSYEQRANDDDDPGSINWRGFQSVNARPIQERLLALARPLGFDGSFLGQKVNVRWASPWLARLRATDYSRYLDECAEQVVAGAVFWRDQYGYASPYLMLFNEPLSGNRELLDGTVQDVVDIVKRAGARLRREGFTDVRFVVPNEETEERSLATAAAILADADARQYVGAIGYHPYPYGSAYASVERILRTSGAGRPEPDRVAARQALSDLGRRYGVPVWMTEVSNGGGDARSFEAFRARAIHIHDELAYADAAAYFGMNNMWDAVSHRIHFGDRGSSLFGQEGTIVLIDGDTVWITGIGYAIGHYARWIGRGAVRIEAASAAPLLQASAFLDAGQGRAVLVLVNNDSVRSDVEVELRGVAVGPSVTGEQSTRTAYWQPLAAFPPLSPTSFSVSVPPESVTTVAWGIARGP